MSDPTRISVLPPVLSIVLATWTRQVHPLAGALVTTVAFAVVGLFL
jgi:hypothetical protein